MLGAELSDSRTNKTNDQDSTDRSNSTMKIRASHDIDEDDLLDLFLESEDPEELEDEDEEPEAEEESETERPVSELLHQLLVATRHNSTVETELVTLTNSSSSVSYIIPPPPPPPEEESKSNTTVEPTEKPEESMTGTTAFTISTTPATIETDATNAPVITPDAPSISFSVVPPSVPSVILPEQPATSTESHPQHPPTWSTEDHKESSPAEEEQKVTDSHVSETLATLQEIYTLIQGNLGVPNDPGYEGDLRGEFHIVSDDHRLNREN